MPNNLLCMINGHKLGTRVNKPMRLFMHVCERCAFIFTIYAAITTPLPDEDTGTDTETPGQ